MSERPATFKEMILVGVIGAAVGLYFILVGAGALPIPGGPRNLHAPLWVVLCAGLAFFLGGAAVLIGAAGHADATGTLPEATPKALRIAQYFIGMSIFVCFGAIASWIAFAPGPREFSGSFMGVETPTSAAVGRAVFGASAIIIWLCTLAVAVSGARKLFGRDKKA
ncbi:MAG: hypothetical protein HY659_00025 [Rhizobiales bacterium]|nr:hypothetical protein [Hyphomicrobiales bacterium]